MLSRRSRKAIRSEYAATAEAEGAAITRKIYDRSSDEIPVRTENCVYRLGKNFKAPLKLMARTSPD